jgi:hypothetical protein
MARFWWRFWGALALRSSAYEDVESDHRALPQAVGVVVLSSLATGAPYLQDAGLRGSIGGLIGALLGWLCWSWLTYHIGVRWLPGDNTRANWGEVLRTTGFAASPGVLRAVGWAMPEARLVLLWLTSVWMLLAFVVAIRRALDYDRIWRPVVVCSLGWIIYAGLLLIAPSGCRLGGW